MVRDSQDLILITGASGHVGFRILISALQAGYFVRAAVRSQAKAQNLLSHPETRAFNTQSQLTFSIVPDIAIPSAYDESVRDVRYIIHTASPLMSNKPPTGLDEDDFFIKPAVCGTLSMLNAAKKCTSLRRIVITSSITALVPIDQLTGVCSAHRIIQPTDRIPFVCGPYETEFAAYAASKVAALIAAENWMRTQKPNFDIIHLHPSFVQGRNNLAMHPREALRGTNSIILGIALGRNMGSIAGASAHIEDVARVHVQALEPKIPGNSSYILSQESRWDEVHEVLQREFSAAVATGLLPNCGQVKTHELAINAMSTETTFMFRHRKLDEQVKSVIGHYLELRSRRNVVPESTKSREVVIPMSEFVKLSLKA